MDESEKITGMGKEENLPEIILEPKREISGIRMAIGKNESKFKASASKSMANISVWIIGIK